MPSVDPVPHCRLESPRRLIPCGWVLALALAGCVLPPDRQVDLRDAVSTVDAAGRGGSGGAGNGGSGGGGSGGSGAAGTGGAGGAANGGSLSSDVGIVATDGPPASDVGPFVDAAAVCIPADEICNGLDDDCDGESDEGLGLGDACAGACGAGHQECGAAGETRCSADPGGSACTLCGGGADVPCNGCPAGTAVPAGFVCVPPGVFTMGSPPDEPGRNDDETQHEVTLTRPFVLKATEVTQGEWQAVMGNQPSYFGSCGADCPVERVSWYDAAEYLNRLSVGAGLAPCYDLVNCRGNVGAGCPPLFSGCSGDFVCDLLEARGTPACPGYRFPSEAEWEYAARAVTQTAFWSGAVTEIHCGLEPNLDPTGWYCGNSMVQYPECFDNTARGGTNCEGTHIVGRKAPNAWGLHDVHGNVWEWVNDVYGGYGQEAVQDPSGPVGRDLRVSRGGSWHDDALYTRSAFRGTYPPENRYFNMGFRPARTAPQRECIPADEICNGLDDDCDGESDEGLGLGDPCAGACGTGQRECGAGGETRCSADPGGSACTQCDGGMAAPCNGCPAGTAVPAGYVCAPAGVFTMGSPPDEPSVANHEADETQHEVTLTRPFLLKATEVTQAEFASMGVRPSFFAGCDNCPVERVSWFEAVAYLNALSVLAGRQECYAVIGSHGAFGGGCNAGINSCAGDFGFDSVSFVGLDCTGYRLPTEAEWEYAARAGTAESSYNGAVGDVACVFDASLDPIAWYCANSGGRTHVVGGKRANAWGLYDMLGNVWEWNHDWYVDYPAGPGVDPTGPAAGAIRVLRGAATADDARHYRAAGRNAGAPEFRGRTVGFRPARTLP